LVLFNECVACPKVLQVIVVIISFFHRCKKFFKIDIGVEKNFMPDSLREWIPDWSKLCFVDKDVLNVLRAEDRDKVLSFSK
jgi:hypothetical protein